MQLLNFTSVQFVSTYVKVGRSCTLIVCLNMVEMTYTTLNRQHILAGVEDTDLKKVYNFPSNNLHRGFNEIRGHLTQIYNDQDNAYFNKKNFHLLYLKETVLDFLCLN